MQKDMALRMFCFIMCMEYLKRDNLGHVIAGENGDVGDIYNTAEGKEKLEDTYKLGLSI